MTPQQFLEVKRIQQMIIDEANQTVIDARREAEQCPFPRHIRPAGPEDIKAGTVIWYKQGESQGFWEIVKKRENQWEWWYTGEDGCLYRINENAYVEVPPEEVPLFTPEQVKGAIRQWLDLGERRKISGFHSREWFARCLKWHLEQLEKE